MVRLNIFLVAFTFFVFEATAQLNLSLESGVNLSNSVHLRDLSFPNENRRVYSWEGGALLSYRIKRKVNVELAVNRSRLVNAIRIADLPIFRTDQHFLGLDVEPHIWSFSLNVGLPINFSERMRLRPYIGMRQSYLEQGAGIYRKDGTLVERIEDIEYEVEYNIYTLSARREPMFYQCGALLEWDITSRLALRLRGNYFNSSNSALTTGVRYHMRAVQVDMRDELRIVNTGNSFQLLGGISYRIAW